MSIRKLILLNAIVLIGPITLAACDGVATPIAKPAVTLAKPTVVAAQSVAIAVIPTAAHTTQDALSVVTASGKFKTLLTALNAASMTNVLKSAGPFTLLAPTDDAFAKLPKSTIVDLLKPVNKKMLVSLLASHIVSGKDTLADLAKVKSVKTLDGSEFAVAIDGSATSIGNAKIVVPDVSASNGVIQGIDTVLGIVH